LSVNIFQNTLTDQKYEKFYRTRKGNTAIRSHQKSYRSEFVAVYGRRRVCKTMLIRQVFNKEFTFHVIAIGNVNKQ